MRCNFYSLILLLVFSAVIGCTKTIPKLPAALPPPSNVKWLGHKGAGSNNYNDVNMEHSIASFRQALQTMDGVEIDLQMSLDGTLWLFHDINTGGDLCSSTLSQSLISMHDSQISNLQLCSRTKTDRIYKFSELLDLWDSTSNGFYISIEMKEDFDDSMYTNAGGKSYYFTKEADQLAALLSTHLNHPLSKIIVEISQSSVCDYIRSYPALQGVKYFLFEYKPFADIVYDAKAGNWDGFSCNYTDTTITAGGVQDAKNSGLEVQMWTPYSTGDLEDVYELRPDYVQTDNMAVKALLHLN